MKRNKIRRDSKTPIYLRITLGGKRFESSTHRSVEPVNWDKSMGRFRGRSETVKTINHFLPSLEADVLRKYNKLLDEKVLITIDDLRLMFSVGKLNQKTILQSASENNEFIALEIGSKYPSSTVD